MLSSVEREVCKISKISFLKLSTTSSSLSNYRLILFSSLLKMGPQMKHQWLSLKMKCRFALFESVKQFPTNRLCVAKLSRKTSYSLGIDDRAIFAGLARGTKWFFAAYNTCHEKVPSKDLKPIRKINYRTRRRVTRSHAATKCDTTSTSRP